MAEDIFIPRETVNDEQVRIALLMPPNGSFVNKGELIAEIETSKINISVEAPVDGYIEWLCRQGAEVVATSCIAKIHPTSADVPFSRNHEPATDRPNRYGNAGNPQDIITHTLVGSLKDGNPLFSDAAKFGNRIFDSELESIGTGQVSAPPDKHDSQVAPPTPPHKSFATNIRCDLYRYMAKHGWKAFLSAVRSEPGFCATVIYRIGYAAKAHRIARKIIFPFCRIGQRYYRLIYGISIPFETQIGAGLNFPHWGGIWINPQAVIGENVTIGHDVSIGSAGPNPGGHPIIGNRVYISPGARITGPVSIGSDVLVTANALVTKDAPDGSILIGVPAKIEGKQSRNKHIININQ